MVSRPLSPDELQPPAAQTIRLVMTTITLEMPDDIFSTLRRSPSELACEVLLAAAMRWYSQGEISQEKAAEIARMDRTDFLVELSRHKVDAFVVDFDDLKRELRQG